MNRVVMIGRTTKEIELKTTPSGASVAEFSIAVRRAYKNANGENESDFFNCIAFVVRPIITTLFILYLPRFLDTFQCQL